MAPILEARGLSRSFGHVRALIDADFDVDEGEVVELASSIRELIGHLRGTRTRLLGRGR